MPRIIRGLILAIGTTLACCLIGGQAIAANWDKLSSARLVEGGYYDGDSFHLTAKGKDYIFRLYFVDAPETAADYPDRVQAQAKHFSIDEKRALELGEEARDFAHEFLRAGGVMVKTCWEDARGASAQPRYYAIIETPKGNLAEELVKQGLARVYGMPTPERWPGGKTAPDFVNDLDQLEQRAKRAGVGGWARPGQPKASPTLPGMILPPTTFMPTPSRTEPSPTPEATPPVASEDHAGRVNVNTATAEELESLPKIGAVYARKIIEGRPWKRADDIVQIGGLTAAAVEQIKDLIYAAPPEALPNTARFYQENSSKWLNHLVEIEVSAVEPIRADAPPGFVPVISQTTHNGSDGGKIMLYVAQKAYQPLLKYVAERSNGTSATKALVKGTLFDYRGTVGIVVQP